MQPSWTTAFLNHPWLAPATWAVLHTLDYYLTIWGATVYRAGANQFIVMPGSYELNPLFQEDIDRRRLASRRFLVTLLVTAVVLYALASLAALVPRESTGPEAFAFVMGMIVFTRASVIDGHLHGIWVFRRMTRPAAPIRGRIRHSRRGVYQLTAVKMAREAAFLVLAAAFAPSAWVLGGILGLGLIAAKMWGLSLKASDEVPDGPAPEGITEAEVSLPAS